MDMNRPMNKQGTKERCLHEITRRHFFRESGFGIGSLALASLMNNRLAFPQSKGPAMPSSPLSPKPPHFAPKAKSIVYLFMAGAPSHLDLLDYKRKLNELDGKPIPESLIKGERFAFIRGVPNLLGSFAKFQKHGQSGAEVSHLLPHLTEVVDEIAIVKSMRATQFNHAPAQIFMNTGHQIIGRPSMGAWLTYGWAASRAISPALWCSCRARASRMAESRAGGAAFCPRCIRGWSSVPRETPSCSFPTRLA